MKKVQARLLNCVSAGLFAAAKVARRFCFSKRCLVFLPFFPASQIFCQTTELSGVINHYAKVLSVDTCFSKIEVSDTAGFQKNDRVLIFQMKGAVISEANSANFGTISDLKNAGKWELAFVDSLAAGQIFLKQLLVNQYDATDGCVQIVSFPVFENAHVTAPVVAKPWDGQTGGVVAFEVLDNLILDAPVSADSAGFRGGENFVAPTNGCYFLFSQNAYAYDAPNWRGGRKAEGVADRIAGKENGRGPQANGGGGGNDHNSGGGGGANLTDGGRGGDNDEPGFANCDGHFPGLGGKKINDSSGRVFLGGGGGAGHSNNTFACAGGRGGGIVVVLAKTVTGSKPMISANGAPGETPGGDGAGGGGAGGTVIFQAENLPSDFKIFAAGGSGGDADNGGQNRCFGPGGGGSGGRVATNQPQTANVQPGQPGVVKNSSEGCNGSTNGAEAGQSGVVENFSKIPAGTTPAGQPIFTQTPGNQTVCEGDSAVFECVVVPGGGSFHWQVDTGSGWLDLQNSAEISGAETPKLTLHDVQFFQNGHRFRCFFEKNGCFALASAASVLTVEPLPQAAFSVATNDLEAVFQNFSNHFTSVFWDFGDGTSSTEPAPTHLYNMQGNFTVRLFAANACDTAVVEQVLSFVLAPEAHFFAEDTVKSCGPAVVNFQNQSVNATAFEWQFPGGTPPVSTAANPSVTYSSSGIYEASLIASNAVFSDTFLKKIEVQIFTLPTAAFNFTIVSGGIVQFTNGSAGAENYVWFFGDGTTSAEANPLHIFTQNGQFVVTLQALNICGAAVLQQTVEIQNVATDDFFEKNCCRLHPNPTSGSLFFEISDANFQPENLKIYAATGQLIFSKNQKINQLEKIEVADWPPGAYVLVVTGVERTVVHIFFKI